MHKEKWKENLLFIFRLTLVILAGLTPSRASAQAPDEPSVNAIEQEVFRLVNLEKDPGHPPCQESGILNRGHRKQRAARISP